MNEYEDSTEPLLSEDPEVLAMMVKLMENAGIDQFPAIVSERLILFALGQVDGQEEAAWLHALMDSFELRDELQLINKLLELQSLPELAGHSQYGAAVSQIFSDALLALKPNATIIPRLIWQAVGKEWKQLFEIPRYAFSRDSSSNLGYRVSAQDGDLVIDIEKDDSRSRQRCTVLLKDLRGSTFNLWQGEVESQEIQIKIESIASQLGFADGPIPGEILGLTFENVSYDAEGSICLQISDSSEVEVPLTRPIQISQGELILEVDVSEVKRNATWKIALGVTISTTALILGSTELNQGEDTLTIKSKVPQTEDFEFGGTSLLFLKVIP